MIKIKCSLFLLLAMAALVYSQNICNVFICGQSNADTIYKYKDSLESHLLAIAPSISAVNVAKYAYAGGCLICSDAIFGTRGPGTPISLMAAQINAMDSINIIIWYQGECDAAYMSLETDRDGYDYIEEQNKLFDDLLDSLIVPHSGTKLLVVWPRHGYPTRSDYFFYDVGKAKYDRCDEDTVWFGASPTGLAGYPPSNHIHLLPASARQVNRQLANTIAYIYGDVSYYLPPMINSHYINIDRDTITMHISLAINQIDHYTGFTFKSDGDTILPLVVKPINDTTIIAIFDTIAGGYTLQYGVDQIQQDSCVYSPRASDLLGANLLPCKLWEVDGFRGKLKYFISSTIWGKGNGGEARYSGYMPTYTPTLRYWSTLNGFTAASGHIYDGSRMVTRFKSGSNTNINTNDTISVGGEQKHWTIMTRFKYNETGAYQTFFSQYQSSTDYISFRILTGFIIEYRYDINGAYCQARTNAKPDAFIDGNEYLLIGRQNPEGYLTIQLHNMTADTAVPITYGYQNMNSTYFKPLTSQSIGVFQNIGWRLDSDMVYLAMTNEYLGPNIDVDDSIMKYIGYAIGDSSKFMVLDEPHEFHIICTDSGMGRHKIYPNYFGIDSAAIVTCYAYPNDGYKFNGWHGNINSVSNPLSFACTTNLSISATFIVSSSNKMKTTGWRRLNIWNWIKW